MRTYAVKWIGDTIQGEGSRAGSRSVFVRFTGCNAWDGDPAHRGRGKGACAQWCDTDFRAQGALHLAAHEIIERADALWPFVTNGPERWVVLTGGEPMLQVDDGLIEAFHENAFNVAVETNGSVNNPALRLVDLATVSPKLGLGVDPSIHQSLATQRANYAGGSEVKVVLPGGGETGWTEAALLEFEKLDATHYFVQPQDPISPAFVEVSHLHSRAMPPLSISAYEKNLAQCVDFVKKHPRWRLSLQTHKLAGVP